MNIAHHLPGHFPGQPLECLSIYVELTKDTQIDPRTGATVEKVGFRIGGGIDQDPERSPYPDKVRVYFLLLSLLF
jgi:hypothetical protein